MWKRSWDNVSKDVVRVRGIRILPKRGMVYPNTRLLTDEADVHFPEGFAWTRNEPMEYHLLIEARREWDGLMSFYSRNAQHNDRRFAYANFRVRGKAEDCSGRALSEPDAMARLKDAEWSLAPGIDAEN